MKRQALVIGINRYSLLKNAKGETLHLNAPYHDAKAIASLFDRPQDNSDFAWSVTRLLSDDRETKCVVRADELRDAIRDLFQPNTETPPEVALLFFAGHGLRDAEGKVYLAASDVKPRKGVWGFPLEELRQLMQQSQIRQQLVFLDCCHSGDLLNGLAGLNPAEVQQWHLGGSRLIVAACRDDRTAKGVGKRGVLTEALLQGLDAQNREKGFWVSSHWLYEFLGRHVNYNPLLREQIPLRYLTGEPIDLWPGLGQSDALPTSTLLWWKSLCLQRLEQRQTLSSSLLTRGIAPKVSDVYVPLGLVERKRESRKAPGEDADSTQGSALYQETEITRRFGHEEFLEQVLRRGESPKSKGRRLVILGEPGAGKTTLLQQAARWVAETIEDAVAIWVPLAALEGKRSLEDYLFDVWLRDAVRSAGSAEVEKFNKNDFVGQFHQGRVWLFLDGADEMAASSNPLREIARQIRQSGLLNKARILLTCRLNLWDGSANPLGDFDVYRTLEFDYPKQVEQFVARWFASLTQTDKRAAARGAQLSAALKEPGKERIQDLVKNPLRLTLLCFTWQDNDGKLPDTQAGLYERFAEALYEWKKDEWEKNQFSLEFEDKKRLEQKLGELALFAIDKEPTRFRLRYKFVSQFLGERDDEKSLLQLALKVGWLNQVGVEANDSSQPVYAFYHASFQEYFAARAIEDWDFFLPSAHVDKPVEDKENPGQYLPYRIFEPRWKQVILLWLGRENVSPEQKEKFIEALVEFDDGCGKWNQEQVERGFYEYRADFLAAAGIAEFRVSCKSHKIVEKIVEWGFGYFNRERQEWQRFLSLIEEGARATLLETDRSKAIAALEQLLATTRDEYTRYKAAESLGEIDPGSESAIAALEQLLATTRDEYTRYKAAESLGEIDPGSESAIAALVQLLATTDQLTGYKAAESLRKIAPGSESAIAALVQLLVTTRDSNTRYKAAGILGEIAPGSESAIAALVQLLATTQDEYTRSQAAKSLGEIAPGSESAIAALVQLLATTRDSNTRSQAAESLGEIAPGSESAIAALVQLLATTQSESTRYKAAESLGKIAPGSESAIAALEQLLATTQSESTRREAAESLGKIAPGSESAIAALEQLLATTRYEDTRYKAAESLGEIAPGSESAIAALVQLLATTQNESIRREAAESLGKIAPGSESAIAALKQLLATTQDEYTRRKAVESLWEIAPGSESAIAALKQLLATTQNESIRREAAESLGKIAPGSESAIAALVQLLATTQNESIRREAAESLGKIAPGSESAIAALKQLLATTRDESIRREAAESLEKIMQDKHLAGIVTALKEFLSNEIYKNGFDGLNEAHKIIWQCAQNMPYPEFYQAWHSQKKFAKITFIIKGFMAKLWDVLNRDVKNFF